MQYQESGNLPVIFRRKKDVLKSLYYSVSLAFFSMPYNLGNQSGHSSCVRVAIFGLGDAALTLYYN